MRGQICHIEIPADNLESLQKFYGGVLSGISRRCPEISNIRGSNTAMRNPGQV